MLSPHPQKQQVLRCNRSQCHLPGPQKEKGILLFLVCVAAAFVFSNIFLHFFFFKADLYSSQWVSPAVCSWFKPPAPVLNKVVHSAVAGPHHWGHERGRLSSCAATCRARPYSDLSLNLRSVVLVMDGGPPSCQRLAELAAWFVRREAKTRGRKTQWRSERAERNCRMGVGSSPRITHMLSFHPLLVSGFYCWEESIGWVANGCTFDI